MMPQRSGYKGVLTEKEDMYEEIYYKTIIHIYHSLNHHD
jgi:hypothetical protein